MSTTRLMILGLVQWMQPVHGYDVRRELESWQAQEWANIAPGSIYHALRSMAEAGLLEAVATEQVGARPARTTYRITRRGELEFDELLRRYWWEYRAPIDPFLAGFAFLPRLPRVEAAAALRNRARLLRAGAEVHRFALASDFMKQTKPTHVAWQFELVIARMEVEIAWCERVAARLEGGAELFPEGFQAWPGLGIEARPAPDTESPDTESPDTESPDTESPDTESPDTESPDTESNVTANRRRARGPGLPRHEK